MKSKDIGVYLLLILSTCRTKRICLGNKFSLAKFIKCWNLVLTQEIEIIQTEKSCLRWTMLAKNTPILRNVVRNQRQALTHWIT